MNLTQTLLDSIEGTGCTMPDIGLLQPADPILDTSGEDLRRRIFITQENSGKQLCLRPEFTIPICLEHLEKGWLKARYAYGGKVFRQRNNDAAEFTQVGFENLGSDDTNSADIDCIKTAITALEAVAEKDVSLVLGDQAIFVSLLEALQIPQAWRKKLTRSFGDDTRLAAHLDTMSSSSATAFDGLNERIKNALASKDLEAVSAVVKDEMLNQGLPLTGGRTAASIAERMIEKAELASEQLDEKTRAKLEAFLKIDVDLKDASDAIDAYENENGLMLPFAKEELSARFEGLEGSLTNMRYKASFGRRLDYYTGFVFELYKQGLDNPLAGGGRYDRLLTLLGSFEEIPAVGFAIWVDRLEGSA